MKTLDCRGLECPLPVVKTKEALKEENVVSTIVDNEIAVENLTKFAKVKNYTVNSKKEGKDYIVETTFSSFKASFVFTTGSGHSKPLQSKVFISSYLLHIHYIHFSQ